MGYFCQQYVYWIFYITTLELNERTMYNNISNRYQISPIHPPSTPDLFEGLPFKLFIIFSLGMHDASSFINPANIGGDTTFQCIAIHLLAVIRAILKNLSWFLLTFIIDVSPMRIILGFVGMVSPVISLSTLSIYTQYELRQGRVQNICTNVPVPDLHLGQNLFYVICQGYSMFYEYDCIV